MDDDNTPTPSTSGRPLVVGLGVTRTPQGSLVVNDEQVLLMRTPSGTLRPWRPERIEIGEGLEVVEEPHLRPRQLFQEVEGNIDEDDVLESALADELAVDSGSDDEEETAQLSAEQLLALVTAAEDEEAVGGGDEDHVDLQRYDWCEEYSSFRGEREEFAVDAGPKIEGTSPSGLFTQIWDQPLMEMVRDQTNKYAWDTIAPRFETETGLPPKSRFHAWVETSVSELYRFFAIMMVMGLCVRGRIDEYWSTGIVGMPDFRRLMTKDRFLLLLRMLHFADNNDITARGADRKISKIQPVVEYLNTKFKAVYTPRRELSLDESLLLWKGHLSWVQCIRTKAARFGIKSYELCEAVSGYVLTIILYTGKGTTAPQSMYGFTGSTAKIVLKLIEDYLGKGHSLYMDYFYNSVALTRYLKLKNTDVVGTLNRRRRDTLEAIQRLNERAMERGAVVSRHCGDVSVVSWKDVKLVTTVSTCHNADMAPGSRGGQDCPKPQVVHDYNKFMGGVDLKDQKLSMYLLERKRGVKWYIKVFRRVLNISIINSYIIHCANAGQNKVTHRQFRYQLAIALCEQYGHNVPLRTYLGNYSARLDRSLDHYPEQEEVTQERSKRDHRFNKFIEIPSKFRKRSLLGTSL